MTTFSELSTAFAAGGTVVLGADIAQTGQVLDVGAGESVTLDLAGHSLSVTGVPAGDAAIGVPAGTELTVEDTGVGGSSPQSVARAGRASAAAPARTASPRSPGRPRSDRRQRRQRHRHRR